MNDDDNEEYDNPFAYHDAVIEYRKNHPEPEFIKCPVCGTLHEKTTKIKDALKKLKE